MNNSSVSHKSHHYFIGKRLKKNEAMKIREIQQKIFQKNSYLDENTKIGNIYTPFVYLGYFDESIEEKLKNMVLPEFFAIAEKLHPFKCPLKKYTFTGQSKRFKYLGLEYDTPQNILIKVIIPFIKYYMDKYIGKNLTYEDIPMIPLFRLDNHNKEIFLDKNQHTFINNQYNFMDIPMPSVKYNIDKKEKYIEIDSLDLMRATPTKVRSGKKTFNEQLQVDTLMSIPFNRPNNNKKN
jgi:hypothetical protein